MLKTLKTTILSAIAAGACAAPALAHAGIGSHGGLAQGFLHPIGGLDHVLAMVAVGMLAAHLGGRSLWLVPLAFVGMMVAGGLLGFAGLALPYVEQGIGVSVVVLGILVALGMRMPAAAAMAVVGLFAVFHGHAHAVELPAGGDPAIYMAGFVAATALLHAAGFALGAAIDAVAHASRHWAARAIGAAMAVLGFSLFAQ